MVDSRTIFEYIVAADERRLSIRGSNKCWLGIVLGSIFAVTGLGIAYKMLGGSSSEWTLIGQPTGRMYPLAQHPLGDRIATYVFLVLFCGSFVIAGSAVALRSLRMMRLHWLFDKDAGVVTHARRNWPLGSICELRLKTDTILRTPLGVSLMLELASGKPVRLIRGVIPKNRELSDVNAILEPVAHEIAGWLEVPLKVCSVTRFDPADSGPNIDNSFPGRHKTLPPPQP